MAHEMAFTEDQQQAITLRGCNILVAAAAGSGKTRVLVERIITQVRSGELSLDHILVLTFTKAAAEEMRERIERALHAEIDGLLKADGSDAVQQEIAKLERQRVLLTGADISTFHAFCQRILQAHIEATDISPTFRIAGEQEIRLLKNEVFETLMEEKYTAAAGHDRDAFLFFTDAYGSTKGDDVRLQQAVIALHAFSLSQPSPETWLAAQGNQSDTASYTERTGFDLLAKELVQTIDQLLLRYREAVALTSGGDPAVYAAAEKCRDALIHNLALYEDVQNDMQIMLEGRDSSDWVRFVHRSDEARKLRKRILLKPIRNINVGVGEALDALLHEIHKPWDACMALLPKTPEELCAIENRANTAIRQYAQLTIDFHRAFQREKIMRGILDFSDLEHTALTLLCKHPECLQNDPTISAPTEIAKALRAHYDAIMVDEYQDTNGLQEGILRQIARESNRFIVGDVKQSIYRFRLADPALFQHAYHTYREDHAAGALITMSENFRSRAEVLEPINYIFSQLMSGSAVEIEYDSKARLNPGRVFEPVLAGCSLAGPLEIDLIHVNRSEDTFSADEGEEEELSSFGIEARYIAQRIRQLMKSGYVVHDGTEERPLAYRDIVILLRAAKQRANVLLEELRMEEIPAYADETAGYFEASEIRMVLSALAALDNVRQDIPLTALLASPMIGLTMEELALLRIGCPGGSIYDTLTAASGIPDELLVRTGKIAERICRWRSYALTHSVPELLWMLYRETGYYDYVGALPGGTLRQANLRMLIDRAAEFEHTNERGLFRFLRYIDALRRRDTDLSVARTLGASENVVRIMTIHKSKGLEFPVVFLSNIGGQFNMSDTHGDFLYHAREGIGLRVYESSAVGRQKYDTLSRRSVRAAIERESKAEEMRILYVAMTRAQEKLILTGNISVSRRGGDGLEKLRERCLKWKSEEHEKLPDTAILEGMSYLDWIALALLRHPDTASLFGADDIVCRPPESPAASFSVRVIEGADLLHTRDMDHADDPILSAVREDRPLPSSEHAAHVTAVLDWRYDARGTQNIHAKTSVTELKRQRDVDVDAVVPFAPLLGIEDMEEAIWEVPRFLRDTDEKRLTPLERGTAMHTVMQQLDFSDVLSKEAIMRQVDELYNRGILTNAEHGCIHIENVWKFVTSDLGRRMREAKAIYRELPFSRLLPAKRYYEEAQDETDRIFLQGIIDVLFEEENGSYILLDYKTDRKISADRARARYQFQINLYSEAVTAILDKPIAERYIFLLDVGQAVRL